METSKSHSATIPGFVLSAEVFCIFHFNNKSDAQIQVSRVHFLL